MKDPANPVASDVWECATCGIPLVPAKVEIGYLGNRYPVDLPKCPRCGLAFVPEELAMGKMADVERLLEDK